MNIENNKALVTVSRVWLLDGDWMKCRCCGMVLVASRDGEPMTHKLDCKYSTRQHPWHELREALG